jgi:ligand-binding sensor domain-containing protein
VNRIVPPTTRRRCGLLPALGLALISVVGPAEARWTSYLPGNGPPGLAISSAAIDSNGTLWFGTASGLARFDGVRWTTFTVADGLPSNDIRSVAIDRSGRTWAATNEGAAWLDGSEWRVLDPTNGLPDSPIHVVLPAGGDTVWFGTDNGLVRRADGAWTTFLPGNDLSCARENGLWSPSIRALRFDRNGDLWIGTSGGYNRLERSGCFQRDDLDLQLHHLQSTQVTALLEYFRPPLHRENGRSSERIDTRTLWIATAGGGLSINNGTWALKVTSTGNDIDRLIKSQNLAALFQDSRGNAWIGGSTGVGGLGALTRFDGAHWKFFGPGDGFDANPVGAIVEDDSGHLWFGTGAEGLIRFDGELWTTFRGTDSLSVPAVHALHESPYGDIWAGGNGGADQWDERRWIPWGAAEGIHTSRVQAIHVDADSTIWLGTAGAGVYRFRSVEDLDQFTVERSLAGNDVRAVLRDRGGRLWVGTTAGLTEWGAEFPARTWTEADGLPSRRIRALAEDQTGRLWCATEAGLARLDGDRFTALAIPGGVDWNVVSDLLVDDVGHAWCATIAGAARFDGSAWNTWNATDFPALIGLTAVARDSLGRLWFGTTQNGIVRFDGTAFRSFRTTSGLAGDTVRDLLVDRRGRIWVACESAGLTMHELDSGAPRGFARGGGLTTDPVLRARFDHAYEEREPVAYSWSLNGSPWSGWTFESDWSYPAASDGHYRLEVRARDVSGNVDRRPRSIVFEVDNTPPTPILASPVFGEAVRGLVSVRGSAVDPRFARYRVDVRRAGDDAWSTLRESPQPVDDALLAEWNTTGVTDGRYDLQVTVTDSLGVPGSVRVTVIVDNEFPDVAVTSPAAVPASSGGEVYSEDGQARLVLAPRALDRDAVVSIEPLGENAGPDTTMAGGPGGRTWRVDWGPARLSKPASLLLTPATPLAAPRIAWTAWFRPAGGGWAPLGGTPTDGGHIAVPLREPGDIGLFARGGAPPIAGGARLSALALTPRVVTVGAAPRPVAISFRLSERARVEARVYSQSGLLVRVVESGAELPAGEHLLEWDGRTSAGDWPHDGLYILAVEANGETATKTVAVRR